MISGTESAMADKMSEFFLKFYTNLATFLERRQSHSKKFWKKGKRIEIRRCKVQSYIFYKHFLISAILHERSTLINFGFLIKVSILNSNFSVSIQNFSSIYKIPWIWCDNVNFSKNSKSYKIWTFTLISAKFLKENYQHFICNYKELFVSKLEFGGTLSENALHSKNLKFYTI